MIKMVHVLILIIVAFMLYYLSRCNDYNGFSVGSQEVDCSPWNGSQAGCDSQFFDCIYINESCQNIEETSCEELTDIQGQWFAPDNSWGSSSPKYACLYTSIKTIKNNYMENVSGSPCIWAKYSASGEKCKSVSDTTCKELDINDCDDDLNVSGSPCVWATRNNSESEKKCQSASKTTCKELGFIPCMNADAHGRHEDPALIVSGGPCIISASGLKCKSASEIICEDLSSDECLDERNDDADAEALDKPCILDDSKCVSTEQYNKNYISISDGLKLSNDCKDLIKE